jgi:hypothetical protein
MTKKRILTWTLFAISVVIGMTAYILLLTGYTYEHGTCWDGYDYEKNQPVGGCDLHEHTSYPPLPFLVWLISLLEKK